MYHDLAKLFLGALLVAGGGALWAFLDAGEAGAAMIGAGGAMLPSGLREARGASAS